VINDGVRNLPNNLSAMYGGASRWTTTYIIRIMAKSFFFLLQPVSQDRKDEKSSPYTTATTAFIWNTNTVDGVFGRRFIPLTSRTEDVGGRRGRHHELENALD